MTRGDLVRLQSNEVSGVIVMGTPGQERHVFDHGEVAVYLGVWQAAASHRSESKIQVLVQDVIGWIYESECEVINAEG